MKKTEIDNIQAERLAIQQGQIAPGRVWVVTKEADGKIRRKQASPEGFRRKQARAWEAKTEAAQIRHKINLPQKEFADSIGVSVATLRKWESGAAKPSRAARVLLRVAEIDLQVAQKASKSVPAEA